MVTSPGPACSKDRRLGCVHSLCPSQGPDTAFIHLSSLISFLDSLHILPCVLQAVGGPRALWIMGLSWC